MRINVYSQELTSEVIELEKVSNTGRVYKAAQLILHSSERLHHPPEDDDRSAVTFWLPSSQHRREEMARAFERIATIFRYGDTVAPRPVDQPRAVPDDAWPRLELWFFRELVEAQRLKLFALHGMPVDEIGASHVNQKRALRHLLAAAPPSNSPTTGAIGENGNG